MENLLYFFRERMIEITFTQLSGSVTTTEIHRHVKDNVYRIHVPDGIVVWVVRAVRSCRARRKNRFYVFQHRGTPVRLRCQRTVTQHPAWTASDLKTVCRRARPSGRRGIGSWKNLRGRGNAADSDRSACQWQTEIDGDAAPARRGWTGRACARPRCHCWTNRERGAIWKRWHTGGSGSGNGLL